MFRFDTTEHAQQVFDALLDDLEARGYRTVRREKSTAVMDMGVALLSFRVEPLGIRGEVVG